MILEEVFGKDIWLIPNGANSLNLIKLPEREGKKPIFAIIKFHEQDAMLIAHLNPGQEVDLTAPTPPRLHVLYQVGKYETEAELFSVSPYDVKSYSIDNRVFDLQFYEAGFLPELQAREDANALFCKQLIIDLALSWAQKQTINLEVRFEALFEAIKKQKEKPVEKKSIIIGADKKLIY